jgi:hypothetical protein
MRERKEFKRPYFLLGKETVKEMRKRAQELSREDVFSKSAIYEILGNEYNCSSLTARNHVKDLFENKLPFRGSAKEIADRLHHEIAYGRGYKKSWVTYYQTDEKPNLRLLRDEDVFRFTIFADLCPRCQNGEWSYLIFVDRDKEDKSSWDIWIEDSMECKDSNCQKHGKREKAAEKLRKKINSYNDFSTTEENSDDSQN